MSRMLIFILLLLAPPACAGELWLDVALADNTLNLGEVADAATTYRGYDLEDGTLASGLSLAGALAYDLDRSWSLGLAYDRLTVETHGAAGTATVRASLPTHFLRAMVRWRLLRLDATTVGVVGGLGMVDVSGVARTVDDPGIALDGEVEGTGLLAEIGLSLRTRIHPRAGLFLDLGARQARIGSVTVGGAVLRRDDDDSVVPFDYGGTFLKAGLTLLLPGDVGHPR